MKLPLIVEMKNMGVRNKGANMMLQCAVGSIEQMGAGSATALPASAKFPFELRRKFMAYQKVGNVRWGIDWSRVTEQLPSFFTDRFGIVSHKHINVVLDGSGFAYGDRWPTKILAHAARHARIVSGNGGAYILLPQAFGCFRKKKQIKLINELVEASALVFARDKTSLRFLEDAVGVRSNVLLAPDFTINLASRPLDEPIIAQGKRFFTIVPNYKMIERQSVAGREVYVSTLLEAASWASLRGYEVCLLNHEGPRDQVLCEEIAQKSGLSPQILGNNLDASQAKWVISQSSLVLSSRYHACVSALSQCVPVVATSWSHKYQELFEDYGVPGLVYSDFSKSIAQSLQRATDDSEIQVRMSAGRDVQAAANREMWGLVSEVVKTVT